MNFDERKKLSSRKELTVSPNYNWEGKKKVCFGVLEDRQTETAQTAKFPFHFTFIRFDRHPNEAESTSEKSVT